MALPIGLFAQFACLWEVTARKPGNVHRFRDFEDLHYVDFLLSSAAIAPILDQAPGRKIGITILEAIQATRQVVSSNTNLGIVMLLAPLAAVPGNVPLKTGLQKILSRLDLQDSKNVYRAIRLANPKGLGKVTKQDVHSEPTLPLRKIMALAAKRDMNARQYANGYREVFNLGVPMFMKAMEKTGNIEDAIIFTQLHFMAKFPDSLISRKLGNEEAKESARRAKMVLESNWPNGPDSPDAMAAFDYWLGEKGHDRNPGTTADLVTATLFVAFREGLIQPTQR